MSRLEWILGIVLVLLLGIVAVLSLLFWFRPDPPTVAEQTNRVATSADRADDIAPTPVFDGRTAKIAFAAAQRTAMGWQPDAALLSVSATWPQGATEQQLLDGETSWGFVFYSPAKNRVANISVVEDQAAMLSEKASTIPALPLDASGWQLDSRETIEQFLSEGGESFIENQGVTTLTMMLTTDNPDGGIQWFVSLFANQTGNSLSMRIDATSGNVLEVQDM